MDKRIKLLQALVPQLIDSDAVFNGISIDMQGVHQAKFGLNFGLVTTGAFTFRIEESEDGTSGFTTIDAADLIVDDTIYDAAPVAPITNSSIITSTRNRKHKRFIRLAVTSSGGTANFDSSASVVLMGLSHTVDQTV